MTGNVFRKELPNDHLAKYLNYREGNNTWSDWITELDESFKDTHLHLLLPPAFARFCKKFPPSEMQILQAIKLNPILITSIDKPTPAMRMVVCKHKTPTYNITYDYNRRKYVRAITKPSLEEMFELVKSSEYNLAYIRVKKPATVLALHKALYEI